MKTHLSLRTADLDRSVSFYKTLLHAEPAKYYGDYALFLTEDPGLELALDRANSVELGPSAHYGLVVDSPTAVAEANARLQSSGLKTDLEIEETCCYAKQTKVWATDPDGRRWEVYTVLEETQERDSADIDCCRDGANDASACCGAQV